MDKNKKKSYGFTLIELLVVIAIIGLLSSIVMASLNSAKIKARDAQRISDLKQIRLALELYYNNNNAYPLSASWTRSYLAKWNTLQTYLAPYIAKLPKDPINTSLLGPWNTGYYSYAYRSPAPSNKYDLVAQLENTTDPNRCEVKCWKRHTYGGGSHPWCGGVAACGDSTYTYSPYLYADH